MSSPPPPAASSPPIPDDPNPETGALQLPLSASLVLTSLPKDAHTALGEAIENPGGVPSKVTIRFQPVGSAPELRQKIFKVSSSNRFETVVAFLTKKLSQSQRQATAPQEDMTAGGTGGNNDGDKSAQVFCYVNSVFAPALDEGVGELWKCFKTDDQLIIAYSTTPAFG